MKERPILFSTEMVKAIINLFKTITRRLKGLEEVNEHPDWYWLSKENFIDKKGRFNQKFFSAKGNKIAVCPYGQPGDVLWVRESWALQEYFNGLTEECFPIYKADYDGPVAWNWKPSIHMAKAAARLWRSIISIRAERLHDISEEDAIAEGIEFQEWTWGEMAFPDGNIDKSICGLKTKFYKDYMRSKHWTSNALESYKSLWISINEQESFDKNPWVWVITFSKNDPLSKIDRQNLKLQAAE